MTDRPSDHLSPQGSDGPTRDIRLPPLPPPPYHSPDDEPTDRLPPRPEPARQTTIAFDVPADVPGPPPAAPVQPAAPPPNSDGDTRRWPWVLLVLLPLLVIAAAGLVLALLLGDG